MRLFNLRIEKNDTSKLCIDVDYKGKISTLWYEVDNKYSKYLCTELADSFLVVLLLFAMKENENIIIEDVPVSEILLFNIKNYLMPTLTKNIKKYKFINIEANTSNLKFTSNTHNGSGISRGVDSFCTLKEFTEDCPTDMKIDILTFFNIGAHGEYDSEKAFKLFKKRMISSQKFALENGYSFLDVNTNISDFILLDFEETHTFRNLSIVFALQKLFKNYYYSSGINIEDFCISEKDTAFYDIYIMYLLSNQNIRFFSSGASMTRLDKTRAIATYEPSYNNLSVCFKDDYNCGKCEKCVRTIYEFYSTNNLEKYKNVFNLNEFYSNKNWYERKFWEFYFKNKGKLDYKITYQEMKKNKIHMKKINMIIGLDIAILKKIYHIVVK